MTAARTRDGSARRHCLAVHHRLSIEAQAKRAGLRIIRWRGDRPVIRIPTRKNP